VVFVAVLVVAAVGAACGAVVSVIADPAQAVAVWVPVLVTSGGREVTMPNGGECTQDSLTAAEGPSRVTLRLTVVRRSGCTEYFGPSGTDVVRLSRPLGRRALVDGLTGQGVPYLDERQFARVTYLPPGCSFEERNFWQVDYSVAGGGMEVSQDPGDQVSALLSLPDGNPGWIVRSVVVGGHHGTLQYYPYFPGASQLTYEQVVWRAGGYTFRIRAEADHLTFTIGDLLRIANGLVLPAGPGAAG
jgi:hypothetical protein